MSFKKYYLKESVLDPIRQELSPDVWDKDGYLKPEIKNFILEKLKLWLTKQGYDKLSDVVESVHILGGIAGYQYNEYSDIDVNVVVKLNDYEISVLKKLLPNGENAPNTKHPVNYYLSKEYLKIWEEEENGVYSVINDVWNKKPEQPKEKIAIIKHYEAILEVARFFIAGMDVAISEYNRDVEAYKTLDLYYKDINIKDKENKESLKMALQFKLNEIINDINGIYIAKHLLWSMRNEAFKEKKGLDFDLQVQVNKENSSINNILYKYIESLGYFKKAEKIINERDNWIKVRDEWNK